MNTAITIAVTIGLTAGNFTYQWLFGDPNWHVAVDRSWSQLWAITILWWCHK